MRTYQISKNLKKLFLIPALILLLFQLNVSLKHFEAVSAASEYERYVHNFIGDSMRGNWTFIEKPMFPVYFNRSQIPVGSN